MPALTVLNPIFVWMLPAAALPVLFHLFFRVRKRERLFSTLMFFRRADPRLRSRRRIREWLTLLLRVLAIVFLLLALARPCWQGLGRGAAVSTVLVVDNSGSMSGQSPKGPTKLALACEAARNFVLRMHDNDKAGIVLLVNDPTVGLPEGMTSDRTALAAALNDIRPTDASGKPAHALERAVALLNLAATPHRELHIFTDLQVTEWGKEAALSGAVPFGVEVVVHRIPSSVSSGPDLAVRAVRPQQRRIVAGRPFSVLVEVLNQGNSDGRARLSTFDSNGAGSTQEIVIPGNQNRTVSLTFRAVNPRPEWLQVRIEDEGLPADNQAYLAFHPLGRQTVLFVGTDREFGLLPLALAPDSEGSLSGLVPIFKERSHVRAQLDKINPAMIVVTWEEIADWAHTDSALVELQTFVSKGGTLLLVPATAASVPSFEHLPDWLAAVPESVTHVPEGMPLIVQNADNPVWDDIRDSSGKVILRGVRAFRFRGLRVGRDAVGLLGSGEGVIILAQSRFGKGLIFSSGLAFEAKWSNLPLRSAFLALAQGMALVSAGSAEELPSVIAGERIPLSPGHIRVTSVVGDSMEWSGKHSDLFTLPRSGVFNVTVDTNVTQIAVSCASSEGDARFLTREIVPALRGLAHRVKNYRDVQTFIAGIQRIRKGYDLFVFLLCLSILAILAEGWLANPGVRPIGDSNRARVFRSFFLARLRDGLTAHYNLFRVTKAPSASRIPEGSKT